MTKEEFIDFELNLIRHCNKSVCPACFLSRKEGNGAGFVCSIPPTGGSEKDLCLTDEQFNFIKNYNQVDWKTVSVNTPIYVRDSETAKWIPRYFAEFDGQRVYAWADGTTSFSNASGRAPTSWKFAKLAD